MYKSTVSQGKESILEGLPCTGCCRGSFSLSFSVLTAALGGRRWGGWGSLLVATQLVSELEPNPWPPRLEKLFKSPSYLSVNSLRWRARSFLTLCPRPITLHTYAHISLPPCSSSPQLCTSIQYIRTIKVLWAHQLVSCPSAFTQRRPALRYPVCSSQPAPCPDLGNATYLCRTSSGICWPAKSPLTSTQAHLHMSCFGHLSMS